jgi:alkyl sulfatase BDS1-like metallo-beta-lactamase superfamily hydrolase
VNLSLGIVLADTDERYRLDLRNGVLVHRAAPIDGVDLSIRTTRSALPRLLAGDLEGASLEGDPTTLPRLLAVLQAPDPGFAIVTP